MRDEPINQPKLCAGGQYELSSVAEKLSRGVPGCSCCCDATLPPATKTSLAWKENLAFLLVSESTLFESLVTQFPSSRIPKRMGTFLASKSSASFKPQQMLSPRRVQRLIWHSCNCKQASGDFHWCRVAYYVFLQDLSSHLSG